MNEDYVSYELAVKLKAAGFDEPCNYGYSVKMRLEPEVSFGEPKMVHSKDQKNYNDNRKGIEKGLSFCSAPHIYHAQKWLRNKYGLHVVGLPCMDSASDADSQVCDEWQFWFFDIMQVSTARFLVDGEGRFDSYEQALSEGIKSALELIKKGE